MTDSQRTNDSGQLARAVIAVFFFTLGGGVGSSVFLPPLGWALAVAYGAGVVLAATGAAALVHRIAKGRTR